MVSRPAARGRGRVLLGKGSLIKIDHQGKSGLHGKVKEAFEKTAAPMEILAILNQTDFLPFVPHGLILNPNWPMS
ncbi:MAG: hypothetical protein WED15_07140 [Akkermansiaceae bacterium]